MTLNLINSNLCYIFKSKSQCGSDKVYELSGYTDYPNLSCLCLVKTVTPFKITCHNDILLRRCLSFKNALSTKFKHHTYTHSMFNGVPRTTGREVKK